MINVRMLNPLTSDSPAIGPAAVVVITGERLAVGDHEVAVHRNGQWLHGGRHYSTIALESPVRVSFEDDGGKRSPPHGPFDSVRLVDGAIRSGAGYKDVLARLDEGSKRWDVYGEPGEWLRAIFVPA